MALRTSIPVGDAGVVDEAGSCGASWPVGLCSGSVLRPRSRRGTIQRLSAGVWGRACRIVRGILAGGIVVGFVATSPLATWNDSEVVSGSFGASTLAIESQT